MASTAEKCVPIALGLLRRGRLLWWFAENAATTFAQTSPLLAHAGGNTLHIRNFLPTKWKKNSSATPAFIVFLQFVTHSPPPSTTYTPPPIALIITHHS